MKVSVVLFDDFTTLDVFGPVQAFGSSFQEEDGQRQQLFQITTTAFNKLQVKSFEGQVVGIDETFDEIIQNKNYSGDIIVIPGGLGTRKLATNMEFISKLNQILDKFKVIATVCTGAALLARTGRLDGKVATSNKIAWNWVISQGPNVKWKRSGRWVDLIDRKTKTGIITSAGISAGIDMTLHLIKVIMGEQIAEDSARRMEYHWIRDSEQDEFSLKSSL